MYLIIMAKNNLLTLQRLFLLACFAASAITGVYGQDARTRDLSSLQSAPSVTKSTKHVIRKAMQGETHALLKERKILKQSALSTPNTRVKRIPLSNATQTGLSPRESKLSIGRLDLTSVASKYKTEKFAPISPQKRVIRKSEN